MFLQRLHESVAPLAVDEPRPANVTVEFSGLNEFSKRELLWRGRATIGVELCIREPFDELARRDHPAHAERRRQRLARRCHVDDALGCQAL
jgi:hypothetical protein